MLVLDKSRSLRGEGSPPPTKPGSCTSKGWSQRAIASLLEVSAAAVGRTVAFAAGDCLLFPPGEAHQLTNTGDTDLVYYIITDQPAADVMHYPDSQKWFVKPQRKYFRMQETDYYDQEDPPSAA